MTYTTNNTGSATTLVWTGTPSTTSSWISPYTVDTNNSDSLNVKGKATFEEGVEVLGDLKIKGKSLVEQLDKIEERLGILHPNTELESRWEDLRNLRKKYIELEREIIEKEKMWAILKK